MKYSYFTDIEEVVKWTCHRERFYDKNNPDTANINSLGTTGTANNIRKMNSYFNDEILKKQIRRKQYCRIIVMYK